MQVSGLWEKPQTLHQKCGIFGGLGRCFLRISCGLLFCFLGVYIKIWLIFRCFLKPFLEYFENYKSSSHRALSHEASPLTLSSPERLRFFATATAGFFELRQCGNAGGLCPAVKMCSWCGIGERIAGKIRILVLHMVLNLDLVEKIRNKTQSTLLQDLKCGKSHQIIKKLNLMYRSLFSSTTNSFPPIYASQAALTSPKQRCSVGKSGRSTLLGRSSNTKKRNKHF